MVWDGGDGNSAVPLCCASPSAEAGQGLAFKVEVWNACAGHLCVQSSSKCQGHMGCRICWKACLKCPEGNGQRGQVWTSKTLCQHHSEGWTPWGWGALPWKPMLDGGGLAHFGQGILKANGSAYVILLKNECAMNVPLWIPIKDAECLKTRVNKPTQVLMEMHPSQTGLDPITIKVFYFLEFWHQRVDFQDK